MIFDDFKNIDLYQIDDEIKNFILNIDSEIPLGKYVISDNAYINIEEYSTRDFVKLEAHKNHIDIQFLIKGEEKVYTSDLEGLVESVKYNEEKDVVFYETPNKPLNVSYLTKGKFMVLYPDDVHSPCTLIDKSVKVKKAIVKIKI
ncbi:MAG: YhcH/YjgK/YiaL family protein [bacterium]|nr:YhcH/YjgK/YiaL family protein [bacterium]